MNADDRLNSLLMEWQEARANGRDPAAAELCPDCPELAAALHEQIALLRHMHGLLQPRALQDLPGWGAPAEANTVQAQTAYADLIEERPSTTAHAIPGYEILGELGRGGMGVVYKARQIELNRTVALKMILAGVHAGSQEQVRFLQEAATIARLRHPNIVQIYEFGRHQGHPFFSLEFVEGGNLEERFRDQLPAPVQAAALVETLARGIQAAHDQGIVHRDLKPANVLLTADGTPKITDFGLAKLSDSGMTSTGAVMGTPRYMAPEQAAGQTNQVGPAADVYALGVILYELLTGRPPFQAASALETLRQVLEAPPVAPRQLQPTLPRDLETICLHCLRKDPGKRYGSALALAEDLRRFQAAEPVVARPAGSLERAWKWARRRPALAALAATVVAAVSALLVVGLVYNTQLQLALAEVAWEKQALRQVQAEADERLALAQLAQLKIGYISDLDRAQRKWKDGWPLRAGELLDRYHRAPVRGWEWYYLKRQVRGELLNLPGSICLAWSPSGKVLASAGLTGINLSDPATGTLTHSLTVPSGPVSHLCYDQSGTVLVADEGDGTFGLWTVATRRKLGSWQDVNQKGAVVYMALRPDGRQLATIRDSLKLWDATTGQLQVEKKLPHEPSCLAYTADGKTLAVGTTGGQVVLWDSGTGAQPSLWQGKSGAAISCLGFVPGQRLLVVCQVPRTVSWVSLETPPLALPPVTLPASVSGTRITHLAVSPDGKRLLVGSSDRVLRLLDATGKLLAEWRGQGKHLGGIAFSPDGQRFACLDENGVKIWDATPPEDRWSASLTAPGLSDFAYSPDDKLLALARTIPQGEGQEQAVVELCDAATGHSLRVVAKTARGPSDLSGSPTGQRVAFSPDSKRLAVVDYTRTGDKRTTGLAGTVRVLDVASGGEVLRLETAAEFVAFSPDGCWIVTLALPGQGSKDSSLRLWDAGTGKLAHTYTNSGKGNNSLVFSPDGKYLALGGRQIALLAIHEGTLRRIHEFLESASCLAFSPDGKWLASSNGPGQVSVWNLAERQLYQTQGQSHGTPDPRPTQGTWQPGLADTPAWLAFSPDSQRLAYTTEYHSVRLWDVASGQDILTLDDGLMDVDRLFFSRDGHRLFAVDSQPRWHVWDATPLPDAALYEQLARRRIVDLARHHVTETEIRERLVVDPELSEAARQVALRQLTQWREAPHALNGLAWKTVTKAGESAAAYQLALRQINRACALLPDAPHLLVTQAAALYRVGYYRESLGLLQRLQQLRPEKDREVFEELAFLALASRQLGLPDRAHAYLQRLRALAPDRRDPGREELYRALLRETEQGLTGS